MSSSADASRAATNREGLTLEEFLDAANVLHHFHTPCLPSMAKWLGCKPVTEGPPKGHVCTKGCEK